MGKTFKQNHIHSIYKKGKIREERLNSEVKVTKEVIFDHYNNGEFEIYIQRVDASGNNLWAESGLLLGSVTGNLGYGPKHDIISDGSRGAVVVWESYLEDEYDIYAQRVDASGNILWEEGGINIESATGADTYFYLLPDDSGGVIIVWQDGRDFNFDSALESSEEMGHIHAQRIDSSGNILWKDDEVNIGYTSGDYYTLQILSDSSGGVIVLRGQVYWRPERDVVKNFVAHLLDANIGCEQVLRNYDEHSVSDFYVQRLDSAGNELWGDADVQVCTVIDSWRTRIVSDGSEGAFIVMGLKNQYGDIYRADYETVTDGLGRAFIIWEDFPSSDELEFNIWGVSGFDVFAQHLYASSDIWPDAEKVKKPDGKGKFDNILVSNEPGGAGVIWYYSFGTYGGDYFHITMEVLEQAGQYPEVQDTKSSQIRIIPAGIVILAIILTSAILVVNNRKHARY